MLQSQLYRRESDLFKKLSDSVVQSNDGVDKFVNVVHKCDALSAVCDVYHNFIAVMNLKRGSSEVVRNFELRFEA